MIFNLKHILIIKRYLISTRKSNYYFIRIYLIELIINYKNIIR
jgi:hypothetical protein